MTIVYACDNAYVYQTVVSIISLIQTNKSLELYLVSDQLSKENLALIHRILREYKQNITILELEQMIGGALLNMSGRHPRSIYAKLFLAEAIKADRVLYLDSDTVIKGSLEKLFTRNMEHELVAGVLMPYSENIKKKANLEGDDHYLCDGVVLFNMKKWREEKKQAECITYLKRYSGKPPMQSEGVLNYICRKQIGVLPPQYNVMPSMLLYRGRQLEILFRAKHYYTPQELELAKKEQKIIHFMNELYNRPWFKSSTHPLKAEYLKIEQKIFHGKTIREHSLSRHTRMTVWMAKHIPFSIFSCIYHIKNKLY